MKFTKQAVGIVLVTFSIALPRSFAQNNDIRIAFSEFEAKAAGGTPRDVSEADLALQSLVQSSRESITEVLPVILNETSNPQLSVRRLAASALYQIATRPDGQALLSTDTATFASLLTDTDLPIRRISILTIATVRPNASSPVLPVLKKYLARQDAVSTIGPAVATVLMESAPDDADSTNTVVQYMKRKDQTSASRDVLLDAIAHVAKSHNREIGKEVAAYADDPNEQTSVHAIETLQFMGKNTVLDNQQLLSRVAADTRLGSSVRAVAARALSAAQ